MEPLIDSKSLDDQEITPGISIENGILSQMDFASSLSLSCRLRRGYGFFARTGTGQAGETANCCYGASIAGGNRMAVEIIFMKNFTEY